MYIHKTQNCNDPMILFLHADGSDAQMWKKHFEAFTNYYCVAPDFPGFGKSNGIRWTSIDQVTDEVKDLILRHPMKKAHVVGLSLGGSIAINLLGKHSQYIDHAIIDGAGVLPIAGASLIKAGVAAVSPFIQNDLVINVMVKALGMESDKDIADFRLAMKSTDPYAFRTAFAQANNLAEPSGLEQISVPTLFVAGEKEAKETVESGILLAKKMKKAACYIMPGLGHGWIGRAPQVHVEMTRAWIEGSHLPAELIQKV